MRGRLNPTVGAKQIKGEDKKMVKPSHILESIMDALNVIINSFTYELYVNSVIQLRRACIQYLNFLKYVESLY